MDRLREVYSQRPILQLPTGGGKTCIAADIIRRAIKRNRRCMIVAHTREIVLQTAARFSEYGFDVSAILAGEPARDSMVYCASIQTLARRMLPDIGLLIIDEAHHATSNTWREVIDAYPKAAVIGLTATPLRLDGQGLRDAGFGAIVQGASMQTLIDDGFLVRPRIYSVPVASMEGARKVAGDYAQSALDTFSSTITGDLVEHWKRLAPDTRTIVFACSIAHSQEVAFSFHQMGIAAVHVDGTTSKEDRADVIEALKDGRIKVVSNCSIFGEGWDLPVLETAVLARPTLSLSLYRQQCGRVLRSSPGKTQATILDHAGNFHRHGSPLDELEWSLDGLPRKAAGSEFACKACPTCFVCMPTSCRVCPECGYVFAIKPREPEVVVGTLEEVSDSRECKRAIYRNLCESAWSRRYRIGWARNQYRERFGVWPRLMADIEKDAYPCATHKPESTQFGRRCSRCYTRIQ